MRSKSVGMYRWVALALVSLGALAANEAPVAKPSLTVSTVQPSQLDWARSLAVNGNIVAWEESSIAAENGGLRIVALHANVGDRVKKGQLLAQLNPATFEAELAQARAGVKEAEATLVQARAEADRARQLKAAGMMSASQANAQITAEATAAARVSSAQAQLQASEVRLAQTRIVAPDEGVVSARNAAVGTFAAPGQELFRVIRQGRLEWRAEVPAAELAGVKPGMSASLLTPAGVKVPGKVRSLAPSVDSRSRNGLVYIDLESSKLADARAGMFARGEITLGASKALSVPQSAVMLRDGFNYVYRVLPNNKVAQSKVEVGRRVGDRIEILKGVATDARLVASGVAFIADGDTVKVVNAPAPAAKR